MDIPIFYQNCGRWICCILILLGNQSFAQKKPLDFDAQNKWPMIAGYNSVKISDDGRFVSYEISVGKSAHKLTLQAADLSWKAGFENGSGGAFTPDNRYFVFSKTDSIGVLNLDDRSVLKMGGQGFSLSVINSDKRSRVIFRSRDKARSLVIYDPVTKNEFRKAGAGNYWLGGNGQALLEIIDTTGHKNNLNIELLNLFTSESKEIAKGCHIKAVAFNAATNAVTFITQPTGGKQQNGELFYYRPGMSSARALITDATNGMSGMRLAYGSPTFSEVGDRLFFNIEKLPDDEQHSKIDGAEKLSIYNSKVAYRASSSNYMEAVFQINGDKIIPLQRETDRTSNRIVSPGDDYEVFESDVTTNPMINGHNNLSDMYLVSTRDGTRTLLDRNSARFELEFSPSGKYLVWFDGLKKGWISYNIRTKIKKEISKGIPFSLAVSIEGDGFKSWSEPEGLAGWLPNDSDLLIYDKYDLWKVDPTGVRAPINLTVGYGRKSGIQFRYCDCAKSNRSLPYKIASEGGILLSAFDFNTRNNGFFKLVNLNGGLPEKLILDANIYSLVSVPTSVNRGYFPVSSCLNRPLKARAASRYLLVRMNARKYPNLFVTADFKNFKQQTDLRPQENYNWYSTELLRWKLPGGGNDEGILYKPENFDRHKKYPVIFWYYEKGSGFLNGFLHAGLSQGDMNIPWFVSNGYLVFVPDIQYKAGYTGPSACDAIVSAAKNLSRLSYVDAKHMGIQGHSFGGYETNYVVAKSHLFAAAVSAAGLSDFITAYGGNLPNGGQETLEHDQLRMWYTLWQRPELYKLNSPIFYANKVTTPILIECGNQDGSVPYTQSVEWYTNLVRCRKQAWLLVYDHEGHVLGDQQKDAPLDFSIRMSQFFDYYLKGAPMPQWMKQTINPVDMPTATGLKYDN